MVFGDGDEHADETQSPQREEEQECCSRKDTDAADDDFPQVHQLWWPSSLPPHTYKYIRLAHNAAV